MSDPIDNLFDEKTKIAVARAAKDLQLWSTWNKNGRTPEHLEPLLDAYQPLINRKVREWTSLMIRPSAMEAEITTHVISAFETYDPTKAALNTHVQHRIQKAKRFMTQNQNMGYIPESPTYQIGNIQRARDFLTEDLGRAPTPEEVADHTKLPVKMVRQIQKSIRKDIPNSALETDPNPQLSSREQEVLSLLPGVLSPQEKSVFELVYHPDPSQRVISTSAISKKLNLNDSQVSRLKSSIIAKTKQYL